MFNGITKLLNIQAIVYVIIDSKTKLLIIPITHINGYQLNIITLLRVQIQIIWGFGFCVAEFKV